MQHTLGETSVRGTVEVRLSQGIVCRTSAILARHAQRCGRHVTFETSQGRHPASEIMGLLTLAIDKGTRVTIEVEGTDETALRILGEFHHALSCEDSYDFSF